MNEPISIPRFIALVTERPIDAEIIRSWFKCAKRHAPAGVLLNLPTVDDRGVPRTTCLVHRKVESSHNYMIPLTRDLEETEATKIVDAFVDLNPDLDFDVHSSAAHHKEANTAPPVVVDEEKYVALCTEWAKRQHDRWMKEREEQGWRYGITLSFKAKTNPLMMPWEQLPAQYRTPNLEEPQALLNLLNDQGYTVITKSELEGMMTLMRQASMKDNIK